MVARATATRPFAGHKVIEHFFSKWDSVDWDGNTCDKMHDYKLLCEMLCKGLVGRGSSNGWYKEWSSKDKDARHRQDCKFFQIFEEFYSSDESSPPWRLSKEELRECDRRVRGLTTWIHWVLAATRSGLTVTGSGNVRDHKTYALMVILPTCLYGFVPAVHTALLVLVSALRRLGGQVFCLEESRRRGFIPGLVRPILYF